MFRRRGGRGGRLTGVPELGFFRWGVETPPFWEVPANYFAPVLQTLSPEMRVVKNQHGGAGEGPMLGDFFLGVLGEPNCEASGSGGHTGTDLVFQSLSCV